MRSRGHMHLLLAAAALIVEAQARGVEVRYQDRRPEPPRIPSPERQLEAAARGTPTKGPQARRKFPVRR